MLHYGVLNLAQKASSQYGDGEGALAFWKNSAADYQEANKVFIRTEQTCFNLGVQPKYRICCHRKIAACSGVFGAKVQTDALHNCFVNDQGLEDTNVEGDLKVEHMNLRFKSGLMQLCGNYSEDSLQRVAKSLEVKKSLVEKLMPHYVER